MVVRSSHCQYCTHALASKDHLNNTSPDFVTSFVEQSTGFLWDSGLRIQALKSIGEQTRPLCMGIAFFEARRKTRLQLLARPFLDKSSHAVAGCHRRRRVGHLGGIPTSVQSPKGGRIWKDPTYRGAPNSSTGPEPNPRDW